MDKLVKKGKQNAKELEEPITARDKATEAMVEAIKEKAPYKVEPAVEKVKVPNPWLRPLHPPSCTCYKCERWREAEKNAK